MQKGKDYIGVGIGTIILNDEGKMLFTKRGQGAKNERGCWEIPGGDVEYGETLADAAVREVKEELGVDAEVEQQLLAVDHFIPNEGQHWVAIPFLVKMKPGQTPKILEPQKCDAIEWFGLDELPSPLSTVTQPSIDAYLKAVSKGAI
jgi:8-oxo-dGTP diphosphatase